MLNKDNFKRYFQFFLVILAAGTIYPVIYLKMNSSAVVETKAEAALET